MVWGTDCWCSQCTLQYFVLIFPAPERVNVVGVRTAGKLPTRAPVDVFGVYTEVLVCQKGIWTFITVFTQAVEMC